MGLSTQIISVIVSPRAIQTTAPLNRLISVGISRSLDKQERLTFLHSKQLGALHISRNRAQMLFRMNHSYAEIAFEKAIQGALPATQPFQRQRSTQLIRKISAPANLILC